MTLQPVRALRQHIFDLAAAFKVGVVVLDMPPENAGAATAHRCIVIADVIDETTYAVALHELGHVLSPTGDLNSQAGDRRQLKLHEEESAWTWARHYALDWSPAMEAVATWALGTYQRQQAVAGSRRPALPPPGSVNWRQWEK